MEFIAIDAEKREKTGKGAGRVLRGENKIPGVVYGKTTESFNVAVNSLDLEKVVKNTNTMEVFLILSVDGEKYQVMLKELQVDITNGKYIHADFLTISKDQRMDFRVPVEIVGEAECKGIEAGGMLQTLRRELDIRCSVLDMPESIKVDVSGLDIGESIHIEEIDLGENLEIFTDVNFTIATIVAPSAAEESDADEEEGTSDDVENESDSSEE